jgi:hypothetical protein
MSPVGFEPTISANQRPQTYALDRAAAGIGSLMLVLHNLYMALIDEFQSDLIILYKLIQVLHNTQLQFYILNVHKTKHLCNS